MNAERLDLVINHLSDVTDTTQKSKYPEGLFDEYGCLAMKQLETPLSPVELARLRELMDRIAEIDANDPATARMYGALDELDDRLEQIRLCIEALPDATSH